ncbi:hypothetical protein M9Y10_044097 [Tritrichomonas musculus]|uniref:CCR4-NOT transcription complex subunit 11 n=1 Tax=Tritrichomonas musculus TaxID=1915356 RepID=A0ABR2K1Y0_9EUKA
MLSQEAATRLINLISNVDDTASTIHLKFSSEFSISEKVSSLTNLSLLLPEAILTFNQQVAAAWIIYSEFKELPISENPFISTFTYINQIYISNPNQFCPSLCDMIQIMLNNESLNFLSDLTIIQIMDHEFPNTNSTSQCMQQIHVDNQEVENYPIVLIEKTENNDFDNFLTNDDVLIKLMTSGILLSHFEPIFPRSPPEVTKIMKEEIQYVSGSELPPFFFDQNVASDSKEAAIILLNKSTEEVLDSNESESLLRAIQEYPSIVEITSFSNSKLNCMIDNNHKIAEKYISQSLEKRKDILNFLTNLNISVKTVEIIKYLILNHKVDDDFIQNYITQSMISIQNMQEEDKNIKAMFFCRFILYILNDIKLNQDVLLELRTFCYEFSNKSISEAKRLYQTLEPSKNVSQP